MSSGFSAARGFKPRIPSVNRVPVVASFRFVVIGTPSITYNGSLPAEMELPPRMRTIVPAPGCPLEETTWTPAARPSSASSTDVTRSEEHTSELQSQSNLVCRLLLEKKKKNTQHNICLLHYTV